MGPSRPTLVEGVLAGIPAGCLPARRSGRANLSPARDQGRSLPSRLNLRAKLDALYFRLYGVTDRDDIRYIYSTFPIVERDEKAAYGTYRSRDLCLAWTSALAAGHPDAEVDP